MGLDETVEFLTGAIQVDGSFALYDATSRQQGAYSDTLVLMHGSYTLDLDRRKVADVVFEPGQLTAVR